MPKVSIDPYFWSCRDLLIFSPSIRKRIDPYRKVQDRTAKPIVPYARQSLPSDRGGHKYCCARAAIVFSYPLLDGDGHAEIVVARTDRMLHSYILFFDDTDGQYQLRETNHWLLPGQVRH